MSPGFSRERLNDALIRSVPIRATRAEENEATDYDYTRGRNYRLFEEDYGIIEPFRATVADYHDQRNDLEHFLARLEEAARNLGNLAGDHFIFNGKRIDIPVDALGR